MSENLDCEEVPFWDWNFFWKIIRNTVILSGAFFFSLFATSEVSLTMMKTLGVFAGTYVCTELAIRYKLKNPEERKITTLIF